MRPNFRQTGQFLYHTILVALHYIKQGFMFPDHFFIFCNYNAMALHACVHAVKSICLKIPSNLLHMELTRTQVHKYDFSDRYG